MAAPSPDPYQILGISPGATDDELRTAYRRLVQIHHPDHNRGSADSARRFEEIQDAYSQIRQQRERAPGADDAPPHATADPDVEARLADLERELHQARAARERAQRAAREAAAVSYKRPSDEELGYVTTDDTLAKILADAGAELTDRFGQAHEHPAGKRVAELIDQLAAKLTGDSPPDSRV